ncbi:hypothetical protein Tco_0270624 [Tanacetum coccineum]
MAEEEELSEQQKKRKAEVQEAAQNYIEEDWNTIRAKLKANAELTKSLQGESMTGEDFAKRMVEMINQKKKFYAEQKAKAKRSKPMTQAQQRDYMSTVIKNQSSWKLTQLKKLTFNELKTEFEKLVKSIENFVPMETEARVKRHGLQLEQETSKKQKIDIEDASITKGKDKVVKEEETEVSIFQQGSKKYLSVNASNRVDTVLQEFGAWLKDFTREDLIELYRLVMQKYGTNRPEDAYDRVLQSDLRTMFDPPLYEDAIWSLPLQQKMVSWSIQPLKQWLPPEQTVTAEKREDKRLKRQSYELVFQEHQTESSFKRKATGLNDSLNKIPQKPTY